MPSTPSGKPFRTDRQQAVHQEPALIATDSAPNHLGQADASGSIRLCPVSPAPLKSLLHTVQRLRDMRCQDTVVVAQSAVSSLIANPLPLPQQNERKLTPSDPVYNRTCG